MQSIDTNILIFGYLMVFIAILLQLFVLFNKNKQITKGEWLGLIIVFFFLALFSDTYFYYNFQLIIAITQDFSFYFQNRTIFLILFSLEFFYGTLFLLILFYLLPRYFLFFILALVPKITSFYKEQLEKSKLRKKEERRILKEEILEEIRKDLQIDKVIK